MATTIQISEELRKVLQQRKLHEKESYEEVIEDLIEDTLELNAQTRRDLAQSRAEIKAGKFLTLAQVKKKYGL